jgi:elongation factor P
MKINANTVRQGNVIEHQGKLWRVVKVTLITPGRYASVVQVEMKDAITSLKTNVRFRSDEQIERATLEQRPMQYLYAEGEMLNFMDNTNYEQTAIPTDFIGEQAVWLQENMDVKVEFHDGKPISIELPGSVVMEVVEAEAAIKGQTASSSYKTAKVENGQTVMVPPFVNAGERIVINTTDGSYVERAK